MTVRKKQFTRPDGTEFKGWQVSFKDEHGKPRTRSFKRKSEAQDFDRTKEDAVRVKKEARLHSIPIEAAASRLQDVGLVTSAYRALRQAESFGPKAKLLSVLVDDFITACEIGRDGRKPLKKSTVVSYRDRLKPLKAKFGDRLASTITKADMREYRDELLAARSTRSSAKNVFNSASIFFGWLADEVDAIMRNPCKGIRVDVSDDDDVSIVTEDDIYSDADIAAILNAMDTYARKVAASKTANPEEKDAAWRDRSIVHVLIYCGLRIGEARALRKSDLNLAGRLLTVSSTVDNWSQITPAKTKAGRRVVAIPTIAVDPLKDWWGIVEKTEHELLFPTASGKSLLYRNFLRTWERAVKAAEVTYRNLHSLRHYYASKLIDAGYDDVRLTSMIGHEDILFTRRVYGHLLDKRTRLEKDVAAVDGVFTLRPARKRRVVSTVTVGEVLRKVAPGE